MSRAEADAKITTRIESGDKITRLVSGGGAVTQFEQEYEQWNKYNVDMLRRMFTDRSVAEEYENAGPPAGTISLIGDNAFEFPDPQRDLKRKTQWLAARIEMLRSLRQRLELFAVPPDTSSKATSHGVGVAPTSAARRAAFIVHGHDEAAREATARVLQQLGIEPIILHEQANRGQTVIEKFERHSNVPFAVVLLTPDDVGRGKEETELKDRARQNVWFELGFFVGQLGRDRVCALHKGPLEIPSDIKGVIYTPMDDAGAWRVQLAKELNAAGISVDLNVLLR